ncbi:glyoxalase [Entomobacter blattae]|uniref:VOC domain-containing protein n=1 Tax=Entomobacter blattae TaxID=2762277 RepID=A0A7H1NRA6_9PROT|nr:glyoxalase [Entomobacter blattae]QNT78316.1 hypothetical protein JGUZn3_10880 [Entomobacter blattae]
MSSSDPFYSPSSNHGYLVEGQQNGFPHVYLKKGTLDAFTKSFVSTFGGTIQEGGTVQITPTKSSVQLAFIFSPVGSLSVFDFATALPAPFGQERTGFMVSDLQQALLTARQLGAKALIETFGDAIGNDAVIIWPNGVQMQLFQFFKPSQYAPLQTVPENRLYIPLEGADEFIRQFSIFSGSALIEDAIMPAGQNPISDGAVRNVLLVSSTSFGNTRIFITNGHLNYPFGRETFGYKTENLWDTLTKAVKAGADPLYSNNTDSTILQFPGGYIAELH